MTARYLRLFSQLLVAWLDPSRRGVRLITALFLPLLLAPSTLFAGGVEGGNAGDGVYCVASNDLPKQGLYSLDYLLTLGQDAYPLVSVTSLDASLARIGAQLQSKTPEFYESFRDFVGTLRNTTDYSRTRIWEPATFGLDPIADNLILGALPDACKTNGQANVQRVVYRLWPEFSGRPPGHITYQYVPKLWNELAQSNPMQLSFLVVHEWLWDLSRNVQVNRRVNHLLHTSALESLTRDALLAQLRGIGVSLPTQLPDVFREDICLPEADVGNYWSQKLALSPGLMVLGRGTLFSRQRTCSKTQQCGPWVQQAVPANVAAASGGLYLEMTQANQFLLSVPAPYARLSSCSFSDSGGASCSSWKSRGEDILFGVNVFEASSNVIEMTGVVTRSCAKMVAEKYYSMDVILPNGLYDASIVEQQLVLYSRLRP